MPSGVKERVLNSLVWSACGVGPAVAMGLTVMLAGGAPRALVIVNVIAFGIGMLAVGAVSSRAALGEVSAESRSPAATPGAPRKLVPSQKPRREASGELATSRIVVVAIGIALLLGSLLCEGSDGVHRWVSLGGVRMHASALVTPVLLCAVAEALRAGRSATACALGMAMQIVHVIQPDAAQATASAGGITAAVAVFGRKDRVASATFVCAVVMAVLAWVRADALNPAEFVEDAWARAFGVGVSVGWAEIVAAITACLMPVLGARGDGKLFGVVMASYLALTMIASLTSRFPVPLLGFGASPILGAFGFYAWRASRVRDEAGREHVDSAGSDSAVPVDGR